MTIDFNALDPSMTDQERADLVDAWNAKAQDLMTRKDEPGSKYPGHKTYNNPLLRAAIEEMRDEYWSLLKRGMYCQYHMINGDSSVVSDSRLHNQMNIICHNAECLERLQSVNYGFSDERVAEILASPNRVKPEDDLNQFPPLNKEAAQYMVGAIIARCLITFDETICTGVGRVVGVPNSFAFNIPLSLHSLGTIAHKVSLLADHLKEMPQSTQCTASSRIIELSEKLNNLLARTDADIKNKVDTLLPAELFKSRYGNEEAYVYPILYTFRELQPHIATLAKRPNSALLYSVGDTAETQSSAIELNNTIRNCLTAEKNAAAKQRKRPLEAIHLRDPFAGLEFKESANEPARSLR